MLRSALGIGPGEEQDRFSVGAATLSLLAASAEAKPVCVLVDDAQWLDPASQDALIFAAKRLQADRATLLFGARDGEERPFEAPGIDSIALSGLPREAAAQLLGRADAAELAPDVADRLYEATHGNPLALLELPGLLSDEQLAGTQALSDPLPTGSTVERAFARRTEALPEGSQRALLVAAVSSSSDAEVVVAGLAGLGLPPEALEPAEDAGLIRVLDGRLEFRHPLVRSAIFHGAPASDRRGAHRALAEGLAGSAQPEARAWHLAGAALGPDQEAADALAQAAEDARRRGGYAAAAAALERAARLSPDPKVCIERLAAAADAAWRAGRTETASDLVREALAGATDEALRAQALRLQGSIEFFAGNSDEAAAAILEAVDLLEETDPSAAVAAAADAVNALVRVRQRELALETAEKAQVARSGGRWRGGRRGDDRPRIRPLLRGPLRRCGAAPPPRRRARQREGDAPRASFRSVGSRRPSVGWVAMRRRTAISQRQSPRARGTGAVGSLAPLLAGSAWQGLHASRFNETYADASESLSLAEEFDLPATAAQALGVLTWVSALRGDESRCREYGEETQRRAAELGFKLYGLLA